MLRVNVCLTCACLDTKFHSFFFFLQADRYNCPSTAWLFTVIIVIGSLQLLSSSICFSPCVYLPSYPVFASMQCMVVQNQIGERARKIVPPFWEKEKWYMKAQSSGRMEQWADRRKAGWRDWEMWERIGFCAWRAEPRHGQFVTRSGAMMEDGDILTPMEQPPQCLNYLPAKDEVILLAPDHTKNI